MSQIKFDFTNLYQYALIMKLSFYITPLVLSLFLQAQGATSASNVEVFSGEKREGEASSIINVTIGNHTVASDTIYEDSTTTPEAIVGGAWLKDSASSQVTVNFNELDTNIANISFGSTSWNNSLYGSTAPNFNQYKDIVAGIYAQNSGGTSTSDMTTLTVSGKTHIVLDDGIWYPSEGATPAETPTFANGHSNYSGHIVGSTMVEGGSYYDINHTGDTNMHLPNDWGHNWDNYQYLYYESETNAPIYGGTEVKEIVGGVKLVGVSHSNVNIVSNFTYQQEIDAAIFNFNYNIIGGVSAQGNSETDRSSNLSINRNGDIVFVMTDTYYNNMNDDPTPNIDVYRHDIIGGGVLKNLENSTYSSSGDIFMYNSSPGSKHVAGSRLVSGFLLENVRADEAFTGIDSLGLTLKHTGNIVTYNSLPIASNSRNTENNIVQTGGIYFSGNENVSVQVDGAIMLSTYNTSSRYNSVAGHVEDNMSPLRYVITGGTANSLFNSTFVNQADPQGADAAINTVFKNFGLEVEDGQKDANVIIALYSQFNSATNSEYSTAGLLINGDSRDVYFEVQGLTLLGGHTASDYDGKLIGGTAILGNENGVDINNLTQGNTILHKGDVIVSNSGRTAQNEVYAGHYITNTVIKEVSIGNINSTLTAGNSVEGEYYIGGYFHNVYGEKANEGDTTVRKITTGDITLNADGGTVGTIGFATSFNGGENVYGGAYVSGHFADNIEMTQGDVNFTFKGTPPAAGHTVTAGNAIGAHVYAAGAYKATTGDGTVTVDSTTVNLDGDILLANLRRDYSENALFIVYGNGYSYVNKDFIISGGFDYGTNTTSAANAQVLGDKTLNLISENSTYTNVTSRKGDTTFQDFDIVNVQHESSSFSLVYQNSAQLARDNAANEKSIKKTGAGKLILGLGTENLDVQITQGTVRFENSNDIIAEGTRFDSDYGNITTLANTTIEVAELVDIGGNISMAGNATLHLEGTDPTAASLGGTFEFTNAFNLTLTDPSIIWDEEILLFTDCFGVEGAFGAADAITGNRSSHISIYLNVGSPDNIEERQYWLSWKSAEKELVLTLFPIPEPSTATLSLMALAGLLARRRRKAV